MRIALWEDEAVSFFASGLGAAVADGRLQIERAGARACEQLLLQGEVDVALVPAISVLKDPDAYDVFPAIAFSTWKYPFAKLVFRERLGRSLDSVAFNPLHAQEAVLSRIALKEHYGFEPDFVPYPDPSPDELMRQEEAAALIVGDSVATKQIDRFAMDLGQEWFELTKYPMVWGFFAARRGEARPEDVVTIRDGMQEAESRRAEWIAARELPEELASFYADDLRVRLDDLVVAGLTELKQHLYYYNAIEDLPEIPYVRVPEDDDADDDAYRPTL